MLEPVNSMVTWCFLFEPKPNQYKTENVFGPFLSTVCILVIKAGIQIFDYIQIKIKMSNSSQEPPASSKTWMFLANFKINYYSDLFYPEKILILLWSLVFDTHVFHILTLYWFWWCKEHPCPVCPNLGLWRTMEPGCTWL